MTKFCQLVGYEAVVLTLAQVHYSRYLLNIYSGRGDTHDTILLTCMKVRGDSAVVKWSFRWNGGIRAKRTTTTFLPSFVKFFIK